MKLSKKLLAIVMAIVMLMGCVAVSASAAIGQDRYSVLVLDTSGSMSGSPIQEVREAAKAFCEQVLSSYRGTNYIAIVRFNSGSSVVSEFTNDKDALVAAIDTLGANGGTDLAGGINTAKRLLEGVDESHIKNILVMCDGAPNSTSAAYSAVKSIPLHRNIYGLYFYQSGYSASAAEVMKRVGRQGYYEVEDGDKIMVVFTENWGSEVTKNNVNKVIIYIACPVDVSVTLNGETLNKYNTQTTFGKLTFEGENNEKKVLELAYRDDYKIEVDGTGEGTMDYSVKYLCNSEELFNVTYPTVDITSDTKITSGVDVDNAAITLDVDNDGDGDVDEKISANASTTNFFYRVKTFFTELYYKFIEIINKIFAGFIK